MFQANGLSYSNAVFNNTIWKRLVFAQKPADPSLMVGSDGVITLNQPGWWRIHAQGYWHPPSIQTSNYIAIRDLNAGGILAVGNQDNPAGQHPSVTVDNLVYSNGSRRVELIARWISTASNDQTATHNMQQDGIYVFAHGHLIG